MSQVNTNSFPFTMEQLVPHGHPMILIDTATSASDSQLTASVTICSDCLFFDSNLDGIPSWVGMEMMAQTIAAYAGYQNLKNGQPVKKGFLLGTRKYQCDVPVFLNHQTLVITAEKLYQEENGLGSFKCLIELNGDTIATANINVFSPEDIDQFISQQKH